MFGSTVIDVVIGLSFIYILLSLVCASLGEVISGTIFNFRARDLERGIKGILGDWELTHQFYDHPAIRSLAVNKERPDYIPSHTFARVVLDLTLRDTPSFYVVDPDDPYSLRRLLEEPSTEGVPDTLRRAMLDLYNESGGSLSDLREGIARWYDDCMDRVSGVYKRRVHVIIVVVAAAVTVAVNADTVGMARGIWNAPFLRETLADLERVSSLRDSSDRSIPFGIQAVPAATPTPPYEPRPSPTPSQGANDATAAAVATPTPAPPVPSPTSFYYLDAPGGTRQRLTRLAETTGFPLGWSSDSVMSDPRGVPTNLSGWLSKVCGWLLTVLVVSFGAPLWFDLLNRFTVIRSTVKPREKSGPRPSKDKAAPGTK